MRSVPTDRRSARQAVDGRGMGDLPERSLEMYAMPGHLVRRMHQASQAIFDAEVARAGYDLTSVQFAAMAVIDAHPGLDQATLAGAIAFDRVTIGGVIDRLEAKGFVRRVIAKGDRRSRRLHLEVAGKAALDAVTPVVRTVQHKMLQGLTEREQATLLKLLDKALGAVGDATRAPLKPVQTT